MAPSRRSSSAATSGSPPRRGRSGLRGTLRAVLTVVLCLATAGCGSSGTDHAITLEVQDGWVREPGAECSGARPYLYVHRTAPFRVLDAEGEQVAAGELPAGVAVEAYNEDLGVPRVPAFCRFRLTIGLPGPGRYRLALDRGEPRGFVVGEGPVLVTIP